MRSNQPTTRHAARKPIDAASLVRQVRLVSVEAGSCAFDGVTPDGADETVVVAQAPGEAASTLALRTVDHVAAIERSGRAIAPAIIVLSPSLDSQVLAARSLSARAMLTHMAERRSGELLLVARGLTATARDAVLSLVEKLLDEYSNRGVTIRLQFRPTLAHGIETSGLAYAADATRKGGPAHSIGSERGSRLVDAEPLLQMSQEVL
jgi:hypothetical protein